MCSEFVQISVRALEALMVLLFKRAGERGCSAARPAMRQLEGWRKGKGCDIGYALATRSCEGADSVDACTVTALDVITAFAAPNPN